MGFQFRPGVRENVGLLIGLIGPSGGGKTYTAMELAAGISGDQPFAVIDTEARRALHYADRFRFDHGELSAPFRPDAYAAAIRQADSCGYPAIIVDNMSHEHYGEGGLLEWHDQQLDTFVERAQKRSDEPEYKIRERNNMRAWIEPKTSHKRMVQRLLQVRAHLILCFRAEEKSGIVQENGKTKIVNRGWQPICEKNLPYELTVSLLLTPDEPGIPTPIKLQEQHRSIFPEGVQVNRQAGERIREWARGGEAEKLEDVIKAIAAAGNLEALSRAGEELARKRLSPEDTVAARAAYRARRELLTPAVPEDLPDAEVVETSADSSGPVLCSLVDCGNPAVDGSIVCEEHGQ